MYSDSPTGVGVFVREIADHLSEAAPDDIEFECFSYSQDIGNGMTVNPIRLPFGFELLKRYRSIHRVLWNLFVLPFKARRFDLIFSGSSHGTPFFRDQIITIHDLISLAFRDQHPVQRLYFQYIVPLIVRSCRTIVVGAKYTREEVVRVYGVNKENIAVVYYGGDHLSRNGRPRSADTALPPELIGVPYFLVVGSSYPSKNVESVITAFEQIEQDCRLVVIGATNPYVRGLKDRSGSDGKVIFLDFVSDDLLARLYENACANVYASFHEGFGFPPYEAAAHGTVSIVSNATVLPEIYGDSVWYIDPTSIEDIRDSMKAFLDGQVDLEKFRSRFPELLEKYTWTKAARKIVEVIEKT